MLIRRARGTYLPVTGNMPHIGRTWLTRHHPMRTAHEDPPDRHPSAPVRAIPAVGAERVQHVSGELPAGPTVDGEAIKASELRKRRF